MKKISILCAIMSCLFVIASCTVACSPKKAGTNTIKIGVKTAGSEMASITAIINAYKDKNPDVAVEKVKIPADYDQWMIQSKAAHNLPDVVFTQDDTVAYYASQGVFESLDKYISRDKIDTSMYYDSIMSISKPLQDGKTYFMPRDYNKVVCYYNKNIFTQAGIEYPVEGWTWEDFLSTCERLKTYFGSDSAKYPVAADVAWKAVYWPVIASYGEKILDENNKLALTASSKGLQALISLVENGYTSVPTTSGGGGGAAFFKVGNVAMIFDVRPNLSNYVSLDFDVVSFPAINTNNTPRIGTGCSGYAINAESKNKDAAWDFLKFMASEDGQKAFCKTGNCVPLIKSMSDATEWKNITVSGKDLSAKNHNAFIDYQERDIKTNYMINVAPDKQKNVYQVIDDFILAVFGTKYKGNLQGCIDAYSKQVANAVK